MADKSFTLHHPLFDKRDKDKVGYKIDVASNPATTATTSHSIKCNHFRATGGRHAIASTGFPSNVDGTHIYAVRIDKLEEGTIGFGWTCTTKLDPSECGFPGRNGMSGCAFWLHDGKLHPDLFEARTDRITLAHAEEVVLVFEISKNGQEKNVVWIVNGKKGGLIDVTRHFTNNTNTSSNEQNGNVTTPEIFPVIVLNDSQQVSTIPFSQLKIDSFELSLLRNKIAKATPPPPTASSVANETSSASKEGSEDNDEEDDEEEDEEEDDDDEDDEVRSETPSTVNNNNNPNAERIRNETFINQVVILEERIRREAEAANKKVLDEKNAQLAQKDKEIEDMKVILREQLIMKNRLVKEQLDAKNEHVKFQLQQKDVQMKQQLEASQKQLETKDQQLKQMKEWFQKKDRQLEAEKIEHEKTRKLLHLSKQEMKDMEIHYLKQQLGEKESGQRRQREQEEDEEYDDVKLEREF